MQTYSKKDKTIWFDKSVSKNSGNQGKEEEEQIIQDEKGGLSVKTLKPDDIKSFINREAV